MIEAYAFFAMFTVQILAVSVLHPARLGKYIRLKVTELPDEYFAKFCVDRHVWTERFVSRYGAVHSVIAVLGVLLLGRLFSYMQRPDWDLRHVMIPLAVYFLLQVSPLLFIALHALKSRKLHKRYLLELLPEGKRKAVLERRGVFNFVSPFTVFLAVSSYFVFAAFAIYAAPFPGLFLIGALTLSYALTAFTVYKQLYGKKNNPFETHAGRVHMIGLVVRSSVYSCIVEAVFFAFIITVGLLGMPRWAPFAMSTFFVIVMLLTLMAFAAPPRRPADRLRESPVP